MKCITGDTVKEDGKINKAGKNGKPGGAAKLDKDKNGKDKFSRGKGDKCTDRMSNSVEDCTESTELSIIALEWSVCVVKLSESSSVARLSLLV